MAPRAKRRSKLDYTNQGHRCTSLMQRWPHMTHTEKDYGRSNRKRLTVKEKVRPVFKSAKPTSHRAGAHDLPHHQPLAVLTVDLLLN